MALVPLATTADLATFGVDISDASLAAAALEAASAAVRDAAGVPISRTTSTVDVWSVGGSRWLDVGVFPLVDVSEVSLAGVPILGWQLANGALFGAGCWPTAAVLQVTATHGFDPVPADIVLLVCELAGALVAAASAGGVETRLGVQSERIDDYSVSFETGQGGAAFSLDLPARLRAALSRRFGGGVFVTGSR